MTDTIVTPENHVPNRCIAERFEAQGEHRCAEANLSQRAPEVLGYEGHASTDVVSIRKLGREVSTTWPGQMSSIEDRRPNAGHKGPSSDDAGRRELDDRQEHGKLVQRYLNEPINAFRHDEDRKGLWPVLLMTRLHSEHRAEGRK